MTLSASQCDRLHDSFDRLTDKMNLHSVYFYDALFTHAPELRSMFREDLEGQGMRFMQTLAVILSKVRDPDELGAQLSDLGATHKVLGVKQAMFAPMEEALIDTIRNALGDDFTPDLEALWRQAYGQIGDELIRQGNIPAS